MSEDASVSRWDEVGYSSGPSFHASPLLLLLSSRDEHRSFASTRRVCERSTFSETSATTQLTSQRPASPFFPPFAMLAAASSFLSRSALQTNYTIHNPAQPGSFAAATQEAVRAAAQAASSSSPAFGRSVGGVLAPAPGSEVAPFSVGLWKIVRATNKTTHKVRQPIRTSPSR